MGKPDGEVRMVAERQAERAGAGSKASESGAPAGFWTKHKSDILLALLFVYVLLLGIGTVAELFHIESILRWPIYR